MSEPIFVMQPRVRSDQITLVNRPAPQLTAQHRSEIPSTAPLTGRVDDRSIPEGSEDFSRVPVMVDRPGSALEQEADHAAETVAQGGTPVLQPGLSAGGLVQRQEEKKPKSNEDKYKDAAKKAGEAFLETSLGKQITDKAKEEGEKFISTLPGKIITGAAAAAVVTGLAAKNEALPMQIPEIPLDFMSEGLSVQVTYEGPVRNPSKAMVTFTYKPKAEKKEKQTASEKYRAETAKMQAELYKFQEGLKTPEQRAEEKRMMDTFLMERMGRITQPGGSLYPLTPEPKKREDLMLMRKEAPGGSHVPLAGMHSNVPETLASHGQPLESSVRQTMEARFGQDFSRVRIHTGEDPGQSAQAINALAYTAGEHIVFAPGQFNLGTTGGLKLLAHELAHTIQQRGSRG